MTETRKLGRWQLGAKLGNGGNGFVYKATDGGEHAAVKLLYKPDRVGRFRDEIEGMQRLAGVRGVLPVIDFEVPEVPTKQRPAWFSMPVATPLEEALGALPSPVDVISALVDIAAVLDDLHSRGFSHRDVKPDNLFRYEGVWTVGDLGLIDFVGKSHETTLGERIGPMHFIAPEMLLGIADSDGKAADVYSLAKTAWVLLTGAKFPIPGAYDAVSEICQLKSYVRLEESSKLDVLFEQCTKTAPAMRPTMSGLRQELSSWLNARTSQATAPQSEDVSLRPEWAEVAEALSLQSLRRESASKQHSDTRDAVDQFFGRTKLLHAELRAQLESLNLCDITGPNDSTSPPGVLAYFPARSSNEKRVAFEYRIWFSPTWDEKNLANASAMARLNVHQNGGTTQIELYRMEESFLLRGPAQESFLKRARQEAQSNLKDWLEQCRQKWAELG